MINTQEIRKTLEIFKADALIEVRAFGNQTMSGYFRNVDNLIECISKYPNDTFYFVMNDVKEACYSREQHEKIIIKPKATTKDNDIEKIIWILVDVDPSRVSGVSSTKEEKEQSKNVIGRIYNFLNELGFEKPIVADSGNGYHLLFKISAENTKPVENRTQEFLKALDMMFSDNAASVDTSVFNPARVTKLYGTVARKGAHTEERPHRPSRILRVPDEIKATSGKLIQQVADMLPKPEEKTYKNNYGGQAFDLREFIYKHGIRVKSESNFSDGKKFILESCVFDNSHTGKDAAIFQYNNGALHYKCFHASCSNYKWYDVRLKFEPNAYDKKFVNDEPRPNYRNKEYTGVEAKTNTIADSEPVFYTTEQVRTLKAPQEEFLRTGIDIIDKKMRGLKKGFVTCLSGLRGSGKSSLISQITLEAVEQGYKTALFSGELTATNLCKWLFLQAAGKDYVQETQYENYYIVKDGCAENISKWLDEKVYIYNNNYGNDFDGILSRLNQCVKDNEVDLIVLDNLMALNVSMLDKDKFQQQSVFVEILENFAKSNNIHIIFVAHPRKSQGFLRLDDVSGSGDITNRVDNALIIHRVNNDFKRLSKDIFKWKDDNILYQCNNIIEVCKDRDGGLQDEFIPLYFDKTCKRLKNNEFENKYYGWNKPNGGFEEVENDPDLPTDWR